LIYNPKGRQLCVEQFNMLAGAGMQRILVWPDYMEHDPSKEVAFIHRIKFILDPACLATIDATAAQRYQIRVGWRPQTTAIAGASLPPANPHKWDTWIMYERAAAAAVSGANITPQIEKIFDSPAIADPRGNSFAIWNNATGAPGAFDVSGAEIWVEYSWGASSQANLSAYLSWEALGE
jgi:hypothetical protein